MSVDATGRLIRIGDVCGFASRRGSSISLEPVIIREIRPGGVKGDKVCVTGRLVPTHLIRRPEHMIITGMTEEEAVSLMKIPKGR